MASFVVKSRKTGVETEETVEADTRERAIEQVVSAVAEGESIEVMNVAEVPAGPSGATGTNGGNGGTGATGATGL